MSEPPSAPELLDARHARHLVSDSATLGFMLDGAMLARERRGAYSRRVWLDEHVRQWASEQHTP